MEDDIFRGLGVEVNLPNPENFLKVKETLTRMGIASKTGNQLFQSCHILHKRGRYAIMHFKEMFVFDGKLDNLTDDDIARRNTIVKLLEEWNLLEIIYEDDAEGETLPLAQLKIIPFRDKKEWDLVSKYSIGNKK